MAQKKVFFSRTEAVVDLNEDADIDVRRAEQCRRQRPEHRSNGACAGPSHRIIGASTAR